MSKYERCDQSVQDLANAILCKYDDHKPILDAKVRIDYLFAFPEKDDDGNYVGDAIRHHGVKALGLTRKIPTKERAAGLGDAEVLLDGEWWADETTTDEQRAALLDHELHHLEVVKDEDGLVCLDNNDRPRLKLRMHSFEVGWFKEIAERHGAASQECIQAKMLWESSGQAYFPALFGEHPVAA